jgi:hypothetical protein
MSTFDDPLFERRLAGVLSGVLDAETGPHQTWSDAPAARRISAGEASVRRVPPLRLLAVAAVLVVGGALAAVGASRLIDTKPVPTLPAVAIPSVQAPTPTPAVPGTPSPAGGTANGWLAYTSGGGLIIQREPTRFEQVTVHGVGSERPCPQFGAGGLLSVADIPPAPNELRWDITTIRLPEERTSPTMEYDIVDSIAIDQRPNPELPCFEWSPDGTRFAYTSMLGADGLFTIVDPARSLSLSPFTVSRDLPPPVPDFVRWSPDGSELAYVYSVDEGGADGAIFSGIVIAPADGSGAVQDIRLDEGFGRPLEVINDLAWSPDGTRVAVRGTIFLPRTGSGAAEPFGSFVRMMTFGAGGAESSLIDSVTEPGSFLGTGPAWSPDGQQLAWALDGELRIGLLALDFGDFRRMPRMSSDDGGPGWATDPLIWSADGSQILVGQLERPSTFPGAESTLVLYDARRNTQPLRILPWSAEGYGRVTWQVIGEPPAN